jgi:hypothetical protein
MKPSSFRFNLLCFTQQSAADSVKSGGFIISHERHDDSFSRCIRLASKEVELARLAKKKTPPGFFLEPPFVAASRLVRNEMNE